MKISFTQQAQPSFGYDKKLNKSLQDELKKHHDQVMAESMLSLNDYCNFVETKLRIEEKKKNKNKLRCQDLQDMLLSAKATLVGFVAMAFPALQYADREYKHYNVEFVKKGSNPDDWRTKIMEALNSWREPAQKAEKTNPDDKPYEPKFDENGVEITEEGKKQEAIDKITNIINNKKNSKSLLEEFQPIESSPKGFQDVAGMTSLKKSLSDGIILSINNPEQAKLDFEEYGKSAPRALLLYGPPGCGKTYITQALASEIQTPMYMLNISNAGSEYINMTSKNLKAAFDEAARIAADGKKPVLIFMDEIDSLGFDRGSNTWPEDIKQVATMLQCIDEAKDKNVFLVGATNKYNILDPAVRRRFDTKVFVDVPDKDAIKALLTKILTPLSKAKKLLAESDALDDIAEQLEGFSNSSICIIAKEAASNAMDRNRADISIQDFQKAIQETGEEKPDRKDYLAQTKQRKIGF